MSSQKFRKSEHLIKRSDIANVLREGKTKSLDFVQLKWLCYDERNGASIKVLFAVPKKRFKRAVDRNLIRRRMREAYRLNKAGANSVAENEGKQFDLIFTYLSDDIREFDEIERKIVVLLKGLFPSYEKAH